MKILEEFWCGNIEPTEYDTSTKKYKKLQERICRNEEKLKDTMTDEQKERFEKYSDCVREYQTMFKQKTAEERDLFVKGPELIAKTWTSHYIERYSDNAQEPECVSDTSYTITVNTDGTFTGNLPGYTSGRWEYYDYDNLQGYTYIFNCEGQEYGYGIQLKDGEIRIWVDIDGESFQVRLR